MSYKIDNDNISKYYNKYASDYYKTRVLSAGSLFNDYIEMPAVLKLIDKNLNNTKALDIGCGLGLYSKLLAERGADVTAIDNSDEMLKYAKEICSKLKVSFIKSSFENYSFPNSIKFDLIIGGFMLSYFNDINELFFKISQIMSLKGKCILSMIHPMRLSSQRNKAGQYIIENYFDNDALYESDFLSDNDKLSLKKWTIADISSASNKNRLLINEIVEPIPVSLPVNIDKSKGEYFFRCPSVVIFSFVK